MQANIRLYYRSCLVCALRNEPGRVKCPPLQPIPVEGPFPTVEVDILQLPMSMDGKKYAVVFMEYFTKWPEVFAVPHKMAEIITRLLVEQVIHRHGVTEQFLSDQRGKSFLSSLVQEAHKLISIKKINTSGYHPQCDGLVEIFNSTLINMLSKSVGKYGRDWDKHLPYLLFAYRIAMHEWTKASCTILLNYCMVGSHRYPSVMHLLNPGQSTK